MTVPMNGQLSFSDISPGAVQNARSSQPVNDDLNHDDLSTAVSTRVSIQYPMETIGVSASGGSALTTYYKKRARDSSCVTATYVTWVTTNQNAGYLGALPCGGPLVEEIVAETWQV